MSRNLSIAFVAPPFGGHLFPQLELATGLKSKGFERIQFYSTPEARSAIELCQFNMTPLLTGSSHLVDAIANTRVCVGSNPFRLLKQLKSNLALMRQMRDELERAWTKNRPDLVIADLTVPLAGLLAEQMGIGWWSSLPTICTIETRTGTPAYLGGWHPPESWRGWIRDAGGRTLTRVFKRSVHFLFRRRLRELGLPKIYRSDATEMVYSPDTILGLGIRELEFSRDWPSSLQFVGPLTASPPFTHRPPRFTAGKKHVLVSLGTHLWWAKDEAKELIRAVAKQMPECVFHFSQGQTREEGGELSELGNATEQDNFQVYDYLPYDRYMNRYDAAINHTGTGVMYSCLKSGVPILAWPQDYDQFDHTARVVNRGLGLGCRPVADKIVEDLSLLMTDQTIQGNLKRFMSILDSYPTIDLVVERLEKFHRSKASGCQS